MAYASALLRNPYDTYRQIDVVGRTAEADGPALVQLLYEELVSALRSAAYAMARGQVAVKSERATRATAILFALEAGLDHDKGGDVAASLHRLYASIRRRVIDASIGNDPDPLIDAANDLSEIAAAWKTARTR